VFNTSLQSAQGGHTGSPGRRGNRCGPGSLALLGGFHAFGHHAEFQALGQRDDGAHDGGIAWLGHHFLHKALVDFELVKWQALEVGQR